MKSAVARLQAVGIFQTTAMRSSASTSGSCGCGSSGSQKKIRKSILHCRGSSGSSRAIRCDACLCPPGFARGRAHSGGPGYIVTWMWLAAACNEPNITAAPTQQADRDGESEYVIGSHGVLSSLFGHRVGGRRSRERTHELLQCSAVAVTNRSTTLTMIVIRLLCDRVYAISYRGVRTGARHRACSCPAPRQRRHCRTRRQPPPPAVRDGRTS